MKKIGVFTSGGDAPGMNAAVRSVVRSALYHGHQPFGIYRGYEGMIENQIKPLTSHDVSHIMHLGGTILRSARSERFRTTEGRATAYEHLMQHGIRDIVAIGGDGTFTGADVFASEHDINIVGLAGTIDNDLYGTDYTIGYDTALNTAMDAIDNIKDTADAHDRLFFIEVMGRDAGFIALNTGIATGAEAVLIPESKTNIDALIKTLKSNFQNKKSSSIVIVAEGDDAGGAFDIAEQVKKHVTEYDIRVSILGHIQRGGRPTCLERVRASRLGHEAVKALIEGRRNCQVGIVNNDIVYTPFNKAIKHHQSINKNLLDLIHVLS